MIDNEEVVSASSSGIDLENIGNLRCEFYRVVTLGDYIGEHRWDPPLIKDNVVFHEKTKKAGTHRVQYVFLMLTWGSALKNTTYRLGDTVIKGKDRIVDVRYIDSLSGIPYMTLVFRYRPKGLCSFLCKDRLLMISQRYCERRVLFHQRRTYLPSRRMLSDPVLKMPVRRNEDELGSLKMITTPTWTIPRSSLRAMVRT